MNDYLPDLKQYNTVKRHILPHRSTFNPSPYDQKRIS